MAEEREKAPFPASPCSACGHADPGLEECVLLKPGGTSPVKQCEIFQRILQTARRFIRIRYPERSGDLDDVTQEIWLRLAKQREAGGTPSEKWVFRKWLRTVVFNCATDLFRRERVVAKKRCGACAHYDIAGSGGCRKASLRDPALGSEVENPWFGTKVGAETVPDTLDPPCREFLWRYRPRGIDEVEHQLEAPSSDPLALVESPGAEALAALARLARRGPEPMRRASVVYRYYVEGETLVEIARSLGITERTAHRDVRRAMGELREILERT